MYFGGGGLRIKHRMEVLGGYEWKMGMLWMLILREIQNRSIATILFASEAVG